MRALPILFALMLCFCCHAQNNTSHHFNLLSVKDGMPEGTVTDILQDKQGYIWIGTQKILCATMAINPNTDSLTIFHHNPKDPGSIANDTLTSLHRDSKSRLWISTYSGISLFNPSSQQFTNYFPDSVNTSENFYFSSIKEDKSGNLWCGSAKGLFYFDVATKQFQRDTTESNFANGLADNLTHHLFIDKSSIVWFGANQVGLQWIDTRRSRWMQYGNGASADISFKGGSVYSLTKATDGSIWIDAKKGLYHQVSKDSFALIKYLPGIGINIPVSTTNIAVNGLIGVWDNDKGKTVFYCYDTATGKTLDFPYDLNDTASAALDGIRSICKDHLGNIWIGTLGKGIWR